MSDDKKQKIVESFEAGMTWHECARKFGVSERTVRRWCAADPELSELVAEAKSRCDDEVEAVTYANCLDPDPSHNTLRMFWLKSRRPEVYRETVNNNQSGGLKIQVEYVDPDADDPTP